jgi:transcriptional regulator GlxA family with amidase domain
VLAPRFTLTAFAGFVDALRLAADEEDRSRPIECEWTVLGDRTIPIVASCGAQLEPWGDLQHPEAFDYIVVVGGLMHGGQRVHPGTYKFLRDAAGAGVSLVGLCTGSFILARAGLLMGYECCVSWFHREEFIAEFPKLNVQSERLFSVDRDRLTCAGGTSVVHLAAYVIERHFGHAHAIKSLRIMLEDAPLPADTWQPESVITQPAHDSVVRQAMLIIEQNLAKVVPLATLLRRLGVGPRQIERRFRADVRISPSEYRLRLRLSRARWMLEHTNRPVTHIALDCGFADPSHFSRTYRRQFKIKPSKSRALSRTP